MPREPLPQTGQWATVSTPAPNWSVGHRVKPCPKLGSGAQGQPLPQTGQWGTGSTPAPNWSVGHRVNPCPKLVSGPQGQPLPQTGQWATGSTPAPNWFFLCLLTEIQRKKHRWYICDGAVVAAVDLFQS